MMGALPSPARENWVPRNWDGKRGIPAPSLGGGGVPAVDPSTSTALVNWQPSLLLCRPTCLARCLSAESLGTTLRRTEEEREKEGAAPGLAGLSWGPMCPLLSPPLPGSRAKEGEGGRELEGERLRDPMSSSLTLGPLPPQHPSLPQGLRPSHGHSREQGGPSVREEGPRGGRMSRDPPGVRCWAGGQAGGQQRALETAAGQLGHDWLDARPSVPLSIQGGSSPGSSEAGRALLKSFLCVCVLIT